MIRRNRRLKRQTKLKEGIHDRIPSRAEGKDGEQRLVRYRKGIMREYVKVDGLWQYLEYEE